MDPKMDSGFLAPGETMEDEYDFSQALLPEEVLGIIDQLLCHEVWIRVRGRASLSDVSTDGMAYRPSPFSDDFYELVYRQAFEPDPFHTWEHLFRSKWELFVGWASNTSDTKSILSWTHKDLLVCQQSSEIRTLLWGKTTKFWFKAQLTIQLQEEDFVTHTFNRSLLEGIEHNSILELLEETLQTLADTDTIPKPIKEALISRLKFRSTFLKAVDLADSRESQDVKKLWEELLSVLPEIENSAKLSKPVPESFSVKIQRKLASTIPPRPIVQVGLKIALGYLERLCRDGSIVIEVLNYYDSQSLIVSNPIPRYRHILTYPRRSSLSSKHELLNP